MEADFRNYSGLFRFHDLKRMFFPGQLRTSFFNPLKNA